MGFLNNLKNSLIAIQKDLTKQVKQYKNKNFADATMAACALVAAADGNVDADERRKVTGFISSNDTLAVFDINELQKNF